MVEVEWVDTSTWDSWDSREAAVERAETDDLGVHSCGYLLYDTDQGVCLTQSVSDVDDIVHAVLLIPREAVKSVREVKGK